MQLMFADYWATLARTKGILLKTGVKLETKPIQVIRILFEQVQPLAEFS